MPFDVYPSIADRNQLKCIMKVNEHRHSATALHSTHRVSQSVAMHTPLLLVLLLISLPLILLLLILLHIQTGKDCFKIAINFAVKPPLQFNNNSPNVPSCFIPGTPMRIEPGAHMCSLTIECVLLLLRVLSPVHTCVLLL